MPRIPDSISQNFRDSANWIPLHGVKAFNGLGEEGQGKGDIKGLLFIGQQEACLFPYHQLQVA